MQQGIDKQLVRRRFSRALGSYREHAVVQLAMASTLADIVGRFAPADKRFGRALEIGTGSGALTEALFSQCRIDTYIANDIVAESRSYLCATPMRHPPSRFTFLYGDIETLNDLPGDLDLVASNATVQWLCDLEKFFGRIACCLKPGGLLAFSTFGPGNMRELASLERAALLYPEPLAIKALASRYFEPLLLQEELKQVTFGSPREVLCHIRKTGVNGLERRLWTKGNYQRFLRRYRETYSCGAGVSLTYHPVYCCFKKHLS